MQSMTPDRWQEVKAALAEAMSLASAERDAYLARLGDTDSTLRDEVESLLAAEASAGEAFLNVTPHASLGLASLQGTMVGRRCGPYELMEEIGVGGMSEVYKARRVDDAYRQDVAIKLVHAVTGSSFIGKRLRAERQILAGLQHPNIARLLDGGTSDSGVPYLVMELIDGQPITEYCDEHRLDTTARLTLFIQVCSAVQYAHQHMVIHRDLKPSNILVTREGVPKLLDFGISKILEPGASDGAADLTIAALGILTPQYASPEQMLGESVTTASDVYSLGVLLYELLTGVRPYVMADNTPHEQRLAVFNIEPRRPSTAAFRDIGGAGSSPQPSVQVRSVAREGSPARLQRRLRGDLDKVVLMALRREPARRYGTVEQFAQDLRRHLEHRPVAARTPTMGYLASRFISRHRFGVAVSAIILIGLAIGIVAVLREARIAEMHRAQAEMRFNDVRKLTNSLIFDIDNSIRDVPGARASRKLLIDTAIQYLATLTKDAVDDPELQFETATAYKRLGDTQGSFLASQDDYSGALKSYQRALSLLESAERSPVTRERATRDTMILYLYLSDLLWVTGDVRASLSYAELALNDARARARAYPDDAQTRYFQATYQMDYGYKLFRIRGEAGAGLANMREALAIVEPLARSRSTAPVRRLLGVSYYKTSELLLYERQFSAALAMNEKAIGLFEAMLATAPSDPDTRVNLAAAQHYSAAALMNLGRLEEARRFEEAAQGVVQALRVAEPGVSEFQGFAGMAFTALAEIAEREGHPDRAILLLKDALEASDAALTRGTKHPYVRYSKAKSEAQMGKAFEMLAADAARTATQRARDREEAGEWYARALKSFEDIRPIWNEAGEDAVRMREALAR